MGILISLDVVNELERLKAKIEEILEEFIIKRKEILAAYNGHPDISLVMRKEDWLLVITIIE